MHNPIFLPMKLWFLVLLFLSSCSVIKLYPSKEGIDPKVKPYVDEFIRASDGSINESAISSLSVNLDDLKGTFRHANGVCWWTLSGDKEVILDRSSWNRKSDINKMILVFHELGHCTCGRLHSMELPFPNSWYEEIWNDINSLIMKAGMIEKYGYLESGCPSSIMSPGATTSSCLMLHYDYYMEELFSGCHSHQ